MSRELVPLIVRITKKVSGKGAANSYPDFNLVPVTIRKGHDWSSYVDIEGGCWHYDQVEPFGQGSNPNEHLGMFCVPPEFANSALALFGPTGSVEPGRIHRPSNAEAMDFYNNKCHVQDPEYVNDNVALQAIVARRALGLQDGPDETAALDPNNARPGIRKNTNKTFMDHCTKLGFVLQSDT